MTYTRAVRHRGGSLLSERLQLSPNTEGTRGLTDASPCPRIEIPDAAVEALDRAGAAGCFADCTTALQDCVQRLLESRHRRYTSLPARPHPHRPMGWLGDRRASARGGRDEDPRLGLRSWRIGSRAFGLKLPRIPLDGAADVSLLSRGDVFDADLPALGRHPVVVASRQEAIPVRTNVTVALTTSSVAGHPAAVPLNSEVGLDHPSGRELRRVLNPSEAGARAEAGGAPLRGSPSGRPCIPHLTRARVRAVAGVPAGSCVCDPRSFQGPLRHPPCETLKGSARDEQAKRAPAIQRFTLLGDDEFMKDFYNRRHTFGAVLRERVEPEAKARGLRNVGKRND